MKLSETEFFVQFVAVVAGLFLFVMTYAFIQIPLSLSPQAGYTGTALVVSLGG
ncbi:hypothetical protein LLG90_23520 [Aromatoleum toluclasticum]|uniref:hypothetical protein n=1 Tax=Aromatoleum toluclasticum TaxID=92003 RepID=UPI00037AC238|nr:hypothetical protein [Aromatoleum toluclasticum]MCC4118328.1 hypothetical protein [Aromatoleum toluclasticum]